LEPFLLNTRGIFIKIGVLILSFFRIFYKFPKPGRKRKGKGLNSNGLKPAQLSPWTGKMRPRCQLCVDDPGKESLATIHCLSDILT
jgi:hypothetical protein